MRPHDKLLIETIARHFPDARIDGDEIVLGVGDLKIRCWVNGVTEMPSMCAASLFFALRGGALGPAPVFASMSGYAETAEQAIATGGCNWACAFGPVVRAGLTDDAVPEAPSFSIEIDGQEHDVFVDSLDRVMAFSPEVDATRHAQTTRARFAPEGQWLAEVVLDSGGLPLLSAHGPTVLSVFVSDAPERRIVEVKVDGTDWPHMAAAFADVPGEQANVSTLMRELAIVVPASRAPKLAPAPIRRTLDGIADVTMRRHAAHWPGWQHHGGVLGAPLSPGELAAVEASLGALPADYRSYLLDVARSGAGPGYGLLPPTSPFQARLAAGDFAWTDGDEGAADPHGVLALAHAGCAVMWYLVLRGAHRGEVWVDARSSDGHVGRVAPSFDAWYRDWLGSAVRNSASFIAWDPTCCSTAHALVQFVESVRNEGVADADLADVMAKRVGARSFALATAGGPGFARGQAINPCQGCIQTVANCGLEPSVFAPGVEPS